jgi:hypothetical protein
VVVTSIMFDRIDASTNDLNKQNGQLVRVCVRVYVHI